MNGPRKVYIKSFGCQMNVYDSHRMADTLAPEGYVETDRAENADLVVLNTCHIREKAADKVYSELGRLREMKDEAARNGRRVSIAVAGCVAQAEGKEIFRREARGRSRGRAAKLSPPAGSSAPGRARRPRTRHRVSGRRQIRFPACGLARGNPQARRGGFRHHSGRLRQVLHFLRRALHARHGSVAPGREDRRRYRAARRHRRARSHAARPERQRLSRRRPRRPEPGHSVDCYGGSPKFPASRGFATLPAIRAT